MSNMKMQDGKYDDIFPNTPSMEPMSLDLPPNYNKMMDRMHMHPKQAYNTQPHMAARQWLKLMYPELLIGDHDPIELQKLLEEKRLIYPKKQQMREASVQRQQIISGKIVNHVPPWSEYNSIKNKVKNGTANLQETKAAFAMEAYLMKPEAKRTVLREMQMDKLVREASQQR